jgi:hypothetical protein
MDIGHWLQGVLTNSLVTTGLLSFVGFLLRTVILERLRRAISHEYDEKLEQLKSENQKVLDELRSARAEQQAFRAMAMSLMTSTRTSTMDKRVAAIERLWTSMLDIRLNLPGLVAVLDLVGWDTSHLTDPALNDLKKIDVLTALKPQLESTAQVSRMRPFLGDQLFSLYDATQSILGRAVSTTISSLQQGQLRKWYDEEDTQKLLHAVLSQDESAQFARMKQGQMDWVFRLLQSKVVAEIQRELSGLPAAEQALANAARILESTSAMSAAKESAIE